MCACVRVCSNNNKNKNKKECVHAYLIDAEGGEGVAKVLSNVGDELRRTSGVSICTFVLVKHALLYQQSK